MCSYLAASTESAIEAGAPEERIKVMPKMVEAGVEEYCRWNGEMESGLISLEEFVRRVLDAAVGACQK
jgi:hypothetical protein